MSGSNSSAFAYGGTLYFLIGLLTAIVCGFITKHINESKGYKGGFAWGFWLNVIGIIVVACKSEVRSEPSLYQMAHQYEESRKDNQSKTIQCPFCGASNSRTNSVCFSCFKPLMAEESIKEKPMEQVEMIKQLAELHSEGILTDEEFETKKAELLAKM